MSDKQETVRATVGRLLDDETRRFAAGVAAQEILCEAAGLLAAARIPTVPLKGVLFQRIVYDDPTERFSSDVDLLVLPGDFGRATTTLMAGGFRPQKAGRSLTEAALRSPRGLAVDLHWRLFGQNRFRLSTEAVFSRARPNDELFGVPLLIAEPHDTAAHLVGKFVTDHVAADATQRLGELSRVVAHYQLKPARFAGHLVQCGMGRAARYALRCAMMTIPDPFFVQTLAALPPDPVGEACAQLALRALPRFKSMAVGTVLAHLLNTTLPEAAGSALAAARNRIRHAQLTRGHGKGGGYWAPFFELR